MLPLVWAVLDAGSVQVNQQDPVSLPLSCLALQEDFGACSLMQLGQDLAIAAQ